MIENTTFLGFSKNNLTIFGLIIRMFFHRLTLPVMLPQNLKNVNKYENLNKKFRKFN